MCHNYSCFVISNFSSIDEIIVNESSVYFESYRVFLLSVFQIEFVRHIPAYLSWKLTLPRQKGKESVEERAVQMGFAVNVMGEINRRCLAGSFYDFFESQKILK